MLGNWPVLKPLVAPLAKDCLKSLVTGSATAPYERRGYRRAVQVPPRTLNDHDLTSTYIF
jgi:hypothetical protein